MNFVVPPFVRVALQRFSLILFGYFLCRLLFLFWNPDLFSIAPRREILMAFVYGLRFDLSAIAFSYAGLLFLWMLIPAEIWTRPLWRRFDLAAFGFIAFVTLGVGFVDAEFVKFIGKRTSFDLLFIREDVERHSISILWTYWHFLLSLSVLTTLLVFLAARFRREPRERVQSPAFWLWRVGALGVLVLVMRGGIQFKPLHPMHAYFSTHQEIGLLTLNTPFNLMKSRPRGDVYRERYFNSNAEAAARLEKMNFLERPPLALAPKWNVVVLILESFNLEYMGVSNSYPGYTPFLDELAKKAFFFPLNFANARRSIEGLPAVLCGLPAMMAEPIITSDFSNNRLDCLPKVLGQRGYSTYFLHGAHNGSMHFDTFSKIAGFENFVGLNEYPKGNPEDLDKYWGVLDEPMLQYAVTTLDAAPKPAFVSVFTLSSHHPYFVPAKYKDRFPKGTLEIHESIGYTDHSLREFFKAAESRAWFKNTIFVITADHTQKSDQKKYADLIGAWRVPLFIYVPGLGPEKLPPPPRERITQHVDIMPSVLDLLGIQLPEPLFVGQSVFQPTKPGYVYNYTSIGYWYLNDRVFLDFRRGTQELKAESHQGTYNLQPVPETFPGVAESVLDLKAVIHYMNDGLLHNSLHTWRTAE